MTETAARAASKGRTLRMTFSLGLRLVTKALGRQLNSAASDPPELLVAGLLAHADPALRERVGLLLEQSDGPGVERPKPGDLGDDLVGEEMRFERAPAGLLDLLGKVGERVGAELAGLGLHRVGGEDDRGDVAGGGRPPRSGGRPLAGLPGGGGGAGGNGGPISGPAPGISSLRAC